VTSAVSSAGELYSTPRTFTSLPKSMKTVYEPIILNCEVTRERRQPSVVPLIAKQHLSPSDAVFHLLEDRIRALPSQATLDINTVKSEAHKAKLDRPCDSSASHALCLAGLTSIPARAIVQATQSRHATAHFTTMLYSRSVLKNGVHAAALGLVRTLLRPAFRGALRNAWRRSLQPAVHASLHGALHAKRALYPL
jgi:hypothetical protein